MKRPSDTRAIALRDVPNGAIVWLDGFWGVAVQSSPGGAHSRFLASGIDFWDAPAVRVSRATIVQMQYPRRKQGRTHVVRSVEETSELYVVRP